MIGTGGRTIPKESTAISCRDDSGSTHILNEFLVDGHTSIDDTDKVTAEDVMRVAKQYLVPETRTVVYTVPPPTGSKSAAPKAEGAGQ